MFEYLMLQYSFATTKPDATIEEVISPGDVYYYEIFLKQYIEKILSKYRPDGYYRSESDTEQAYIPVEGHSYVVSNPKYNWNTRPSFEITPIMIEVVNYMCSIMDEPYTIHHFKEGYDDIADRSK
jgi:hypothetical protein